MACSRNAEAPQSYISIRSHFGLEQGCFVEAMPSLLSKLEGPPQQGRGQNDQYVYWICMVFPSEETVATHGCRTPADFTRESFREACVEAHTFCGQEVVETVCFQEPHEDGRPQLNLLIRCKKQHRWLRVDQRQEVLRVCPHCTATLYLEGKALLDNPTSSAGQSSDAASSAPSRRCWCT